MSRMMDNLARILDEEKSGAPGKKTALFVVRDTIAPSAQGRRPAARKRWDYLVWGVAGMLAAGIVFLLVREVGPHGGRGAPGPAAATVPAEVAANESAVALLRNGRPAEAEAALAALLKRQPRMRSARLNHGFALKALGRFPEAEAEYQAVLRSAPRDAVALNNLGALYLKTGRFAEAETALRAAAAAEPAFAEAALNLAAAYEERRDWGHAAAAVERLVAAGGEAAADARVRERLRRLRSLAEAASGPKEKF